MSCSEKNEKLNTGLMQLLQAQELIEQSAFDAINEHDKLLTLLRESMERIQEMLGGLDMMNFEMAAALEAMKETEDDLFRAEGLRSMNEQNAGTAEELARILQDVLTEAEQGSMVIHRMEEEIALARDAVTAVCDAAETEDE